MDLRDLWRLGGGPSRLTWRRLRVLIRGLRPDSATRVAIGGTDSLWQLTNFQLADVYDALAQGNWQRSNDGVEQRKQSRRPAPYPRPGAPEHPDVRPERALHLAAARKRLDERRRLIAAGAIT